MPRRAFTLVELLAAIAIIAALTTASLYFVGGYVQYAQQNADKQTLTVLNDALTRYKCEGGDLTAITAGAPVGNVIARLQAAVTWGGSSGPSHQFLQKGITYPASKLSAGGTGSSYVFYKYNSYDGYANGTVSKPAVAPYGGGVGYMGFSAPISGIEWTITTSTGYWAYRGSDGVVVGPLVATSVFPFTPATTTSLTLWSCSSGSTAISGNVTYINCCQGYTLTSIDFSGLSALTSFRCVYENLTSLNFSNNPALTTIAAGYLPLLTSVNLSKNTLLTSLNISNSGFTSIDLSHNPALTTIGLYHDQLTSLDLSYNTSATSLDCRNNQLGTLNITGCSLLSSISSTGNPSLTIIGP